MVEISFFGTQEALSEKRNILAATGALVDIDILFPSRLELEKLSKFPKFSWDCSKGRQQLVYNSTGVLQPSCDYYTRMRACIFPSCTFSHVDKWCYDGQIFKSLTNQALEKTGPLLGRSDEARRAWACSMIFCPLSTDFFFFLFFRSRPAAT